MSSFVFKLSPLPTPDSHFYFFYVLKGIFFYLLPSLSLIDDRGSSTQENEAAMHSALVSLAQEQ